jgi:oxygen-independent coproporphyrinogen-3 oxidase
LPKRCHFCYFRVYTDKNSQQVAQYLDLLAREWDLLREQPALAGREIDYVYFGGGTPSFLSTQQLSSLVSRLTAHTPWSSAEEITFECEPGTLTEAKLDVIRRLGVTRLSPRRRRISTTRSWRINGRAHRSPEIAKAYAYARNIGFPQINIDLIAGMLGETDDNWQRCIERTLELDPDSVTIYQMELPYNTTITADILKKTGQFDEHVAPWETRRRWVRERSKRSSAPAIRSDPRTRP